MSLKTGNPAIELIETLADLTVQLEKAQARFDFEGIREISEKNELMRPEMGRNNEVIARAIQQEALNSSDPEAFREEIKALFAKIKKGDRAFGIWRANLKMMAALGDKTAGQAIRSIAAYRDATPIHALKNIYAGVPAVVVAAGPSLDRNFHLLKELEGKAIIVTMNRCAQIFQKANMKPDFIVCSDPSELLPNVHLGGVGLETIENLVLRPSVHPNMMNVPRQRTLLFTDGSMHEGGLAKLLGKRMTPFGGGTVAHTCYLTAWELGCDPIMFIGQDLAYTDMKRYSSTDVDAAEELVMSEDGKGGGFKNVRQHDGSVKEELSRVTKFIDLPAWGGGTVKSTDPYRRMVEYFELLIERFAEDRTTLNCTEGGAHIEGAAELTFRDAIDTHCTTTYDDLPERVQLAYESDASHRRSAEQVTQELRQVGQNVVQLQRFANESLALVRGKRRDNKTIARLKKNQAKISRSYRKVEFLLRDMYVARKSKFVKQEDTWKGLVSEFQALSQATSAILPECRAAIKLSKAMD